MSARAKLGHKAGIYVVLGLVGAVIVAGYFALTAPSAAARSANHRTYICAETGKTFDHALTVGETTPVHSPHTGRPTGYPAEPCHWTASGATTVEPTYVLLNRYAGKPEPTFCPDCGRLVVPLNPAPAGRAPPTAAEYEPRAEPEEE